MYPNVVEIQSSYKNVIFQLSGHFMCRADRKFTTKKTKKKQEVIGIAELASFVSYLAFSYVMFQMVFPVVRWKNGE